MTTESRSFATAQAGNQQQLAELFTGDMKIGLALQAQIGPWVAHLGSSSTPDVYPAYESAVVTGGLIASKLRLPVATGGSTGTMEAANRGAMEAGGVSVGIYLEGLPSEQAQNAYCTHTICCKTLLARQHLLLSGACAIVVAPEGGWGTIFEVGHQLIEMRRHSFDASCPIVFIDEDNLWQGFREWMQAELVARGLWSNHEYNRLSFCRTYVEAINILSNRLPQVP